MTHHSQVIPSAYQTAHKYMLQLNIKLRQMNQSFIKEGKVSLSHLLRNTSKDIQKEICDVPYFTGATARKQLNDLGRWSDDGTFHTTYTNLPRPLDNWLNSLTLNDTSSGTADLLYLDPCTRRTKQIQLLRDQIRLFANVHLNQIGSSELRFGSDGSMTPAGVRFGDKRSVTSGVCGAIEIGGKLTTPMAQIRHGEAYGLLLSTLADEIIRERTPTVHPNTKIYTDHLNSITLLEDAKQKGWMSWFWSQRKGNSILREVHHLLKDKPNISFEFIKGHQTSQSVPTQLNNRADAIAKASHQSNSAIKLTPITWRMSDWTFYSDKLGYLEPGAREIITNLLPYAQLDDLTEKQKERVEQGESTGTEKQISPYYAYMKSANAYSVLQQWSLRSNTFDSNERRSKRFKPDDRRFHDEKCLYGCVTPETEHHLLVQCPNFSEWKVHTSKTIVTKTQEILENLEIVERNSIVKRMGKFSKDFFKDGPIWQENICQYYVCQIPSLKEVLTIQDDEKRLKVAKRVTDLLHKSALHLTGRIVANRNQKRFINKKTPPTEA